MISIFVLQFLISLVQFVCNVGTSPSLLLLMIIYRPKHNVHGETIVMISDKSLEQNGRCMHVGAVGA